MKLKERFLFKAKRKDNGEWVYGALLWHDTDAATIFNQNSVDGSLQGFEVDPSTICQCTTLKDRNDNLIWENDYLKRFSGDGGDWEISKVVFGGDYLGTGWHVIGVKSLNKYHDKLIDTGLSRYDASKCEIVGNIFDNTELLEKE